LSLIRALRCAPLPGGRQVGIVLKRAPDRFRLLRNFAKVSGSPAMIRT
jgi:hypothetical protein